MTAAPSVTGGPTIWVEGVRHDGWAVGPWVLGHGTAPAMSLWENGFVAGPLVEVRTESADGVVVLSFDVREASDSDTAPPSQHAGRDAGLVAASGEVPLRVQRLAAYALVTSPRGVLLTQLSERTNAAGRWGLPGGGVDPGEDPQVAVLREVTEETGQQVRLTGLLGVHDGHWVGRAPDGRLEDFHAVRLIWRAVCDAPTDPVVHDIGGTTAAAAWVPRAALAGLPLSDAWAALLRAADSGSLGA